MIVVAHDQVRSEPEPDFAKLECEAGDNLRVNGCAVNETSWWLEVMKVYEIAAYNLRGCPACRERRTRISLSQRARDLCPKTEQRLEALSRALLWVEGGVFFV